MQDADHQVSKILAASNQKHTRFIIEEMAGIRNTEGRMRITSSRFPYILVLFRNEGRPSVYKPELSVKIKEPGKAQFFKGCFFF